MSVQHDQQAECGASEWNVIPCARQEVKFDNLKFPESLKIIKHYTAVFHIQANPIGFALHTSIYTVSYICNKKGAYSSY